MLRKTLYVSAGFIAAFLVAGVAGSLAQEAGVMSETDYDAAMKQVRTSFQDLKKHLDAQAGDQAAAEAAKLAEIFQKVEKFWSARNTQDAIGFAKNAAAAAQTAEKTAKAKDFAAALEAHKTLQGACQSCHTAHREKAEDGSYRIKKPVS